MLQYWIQVLECWKISFNMIQSQFIFDKESEHESREDFASTVGAQVWDRQFCFSFRFCKRSHQGVWQVPSQQCVFYMESHMCV